MADKVPSKATLKENLPKGQRSNAMILGGLILTLFSIGLLVFVIANKLV